MDNHFSFKYLIPEPIKNQAVSLDSAQIIIA